MAVHNSACMDPGHRCAARSSDVSAPVVTSLMRFYDLPFWRGALTPQNYRVWTEVDTAHLKILVSKSKLSEW